MPAHPNRLVKLLACATLLSSLLGAANSGPALALDAPKANPILTMSGQIGVKNKDDKAIFDLALLDQQPQHTIKTSTPWSTDPLTFTGPLMRDVLTAVDAKGKNLKITALNDYAVTFPAAEAREVEMMLVTRIDGKDIPISKRGPLMIIYNFDADPRVRGEMYYAHAVWQIKSIEVTP